LFSFIGLKSFVGIIDKVREVSILFRETTLGLSLLPQGSQTSFNTTPCIVNKVQNSDICPGIFTGNAISKINGVSVAGSNFKEIVARLKTLPRPTIIHFIQVTSISTSKSIDDPAISFSGDNEPIERNNNEIKLKP
jgi:hypothetical protein